MDNFRVDVTTEGRESLNHIIGLLGLVREVTHV